MAVASSTTDASVLLKVDEPKRSLAFGLFLAVFSQLGWGCYPVFAERFKYSRQSCLRSISLSRSTPFVEALYLFPRFSIAC